MKKEKNTHTQLWFESYELYKEFKQEKRREPLVKEKYHDKSIGGWCSKQRYKYRQGKLSAAKVDLLIEAGFVFDPYGEAWNKDFALYKEFVEIMGRQPEGREFYKEINLGMWRSAQKELYRDGKLNSYQIELLEGVGMILENEVQIGLDKNIELYKEFIEKRKRQPRKREIYKNYPIGRWYFQKKDAIKKGTLSEKNHQKLIEIGFYRY